MSETAPRLERLLETAARRLAGTPLHPVELLARIETSFREAVRDGLAPNVVRVTLHPADYRRYRAAVLALEAEIEATLDRIELAEQLGSLGPRLVAVVAGKAPESSPTVTVGFADTGHQRPVPAPGATMEFMRHRGVEIEAGGTRVTLTHTPFTIGRAAGNDMILPSPAVSRFHARITWSRAAGFEIEDVGSRNGLQIAGARVTRATLPQPDPIMVGDIPLFLESNA